MEGNNLTQNGPIIMNDLVFEALNSASTDELVKIAANERHEFNEETVNCARQILEERKFDVTQIPVVNSGAVEPNSGDDEIKTLKFKARVHIILGPFLLVGGSVLLGLSFYYGFSIVYLLFVILGVRSIYLYFKLNNTAKILTENRDALPNSSLTDEDFKLVKGFHDVITRAKNGELKNLAAYLAGSITKQNFDRVSTLYQTEYYKDMVEDIKEVSNQYSTLKKVLQPLIDLGLVEPEYPHARISQS